MTSEQIKSAMAETERLQEVLDITNADHIVLWLEANIKDSPLAWLACRIIEAHEAALHAREASARAEGRREWVEDAATRDVMVERERQMIVEGWAPEHDDTHDRGELANAAACYAYGEMIDTQTGCHLWPWGDDAWRPSSRRRQLVKAGALILAEIQRLDRALAEKQP